MDFAFGPEDERFRAEARDWLAAHFTGPFAALKQEPGGHPGEARGDMTARRAWERELSTGGWIGLGWDRTDGAYGNRAATLTQQVVWAEEYARAGAPGRLGHIGENLLAPTLLAHGDSAQRARFLPPIARAEELWCQGYSEPDAGSDLAGLRTRAVRDPGDGTYRITGQKIWTSLAHEADWCFVLARTEEGSQRHHGLSFLLVPMDQPGRIEVRPIRQLTGTAEFNEVFFDGAVARAEHLVGGAGHGWRVAMSLLAVERGVSTLVQQIGFAQELSRVVRLALETGAAEEPVLRDRLIRQWAELKAMRWNALRTLGAAQKPTPNPNPNPNANHARDPALHPASNDARDPAPRKGAAHDLPPGSADPQAPGPRDPGPQDPGAQDLGAPSVAKLLWGGWHQRLGELAVQVRGAAAALGPARWTAGRPYELDAFQRLFLFSRADTIYGGSDEIQRTIIAERVLHLPKESRR
ncbi:acyl-CoA dehydrogenase family protein [Streptomyces violaceusniger]|uniref:Acyl-CoA dehydrogenase domain-containing protein n=1 Tax=Streptomyces violaceusniger (strain Tu 4113) TaxID=653045 RepID=G2PD81_STRV4|nr:acyl-CoA dehydrogenase family protein [Streptomyces violaceusniger]AEM80740.1 acyl-CoA dehydrogenase domain-containing protein [Streptomyces violaceusniger Tu 4113]